MRRMLEMKGAALGRLFFCGLMLPFGTVHAAEWRAHVVVDAYASSKIMAVKPLIDRFEGRLKSGTSAVTRNQIRSGGQLGPWTAELLYRFDYEIEASRDFIEGYHALRNGSALEPGRDYALALNAWHVEARGARVARRYIVSPSVALTAGLSLLEGRKLLDGRIIGDGVASDGDTLDYRIDADYRYSRDVLFRRPVAAPNGTGASLDVGLTADLAEHGQYRLHLWDLWGQMRWRRAPATEAEANTDRGGTTPATGLRPLVSGREFDQNFSQRLRPHLHADASWRWGHRAWLGAELRLTENLIDPGISVGAQWGDDRRIGIGAYPLAHALGLTGQWQGLVAQIISDDLSLEKAAFMIVHIGYRHTFH